MVGIKGDRFYVKLSPSQTRKRLKGIGFGIKKIESAGKDRALIIHTATGEHRRELERYLEDVIEQPILKAQEDVREIDD